MTRGDQIEQFVDDLLREHNQEITDRNRLEVMRYIQASAKQIQDPSIEMSLFRMALTAKMAVVELRIRLRR